MLKLTSYLFVFACLIALSQSLSLAQRSCKLKVSKNGRCGVKFGKTRCAGSKAFCSRWNWCGTSKLHKKTHQALYDARKCSSKKKVVKKVTHKKVRKNKKGKVVRKVTIVIRTTRAMKRWRSAMRALRAAIKAKRVARKHAKKSKKLMHKKFHLRVVKARRLVWLTRKRF
jgi:hypothetical protein